MNVRSHVQREVVVGLEPDEHFDHPLFDDWGFRRGGTVVVSEVNVTSGWNGWFLRVHGNVRRKDGTEGQAKRVGSITWADIPAPVQAAIREALSNHVMPTARQEWFV